jgi:triphosphatase
VFEIIVTRGLADYRASESAFLATGDPEALHQMRTSLRQVLSALWVFKPSLLKNARYRVIRHELRHLNQQLGVIRNFDVCIAKSLDESRERSWLLKQRKHQFQNTRDELHSSRQSFHSETMKWIGSREWQLTSAESAPLVAKRVSRLWRKILKFGSDPARLGRRQRHRLRMDIKTLRYALQFLYLPADPAKACGEEFRATVEALQKSLGNLNDIETGEISECLLASSQSGSGTPRKSGFARLAAASENCGELDPTGGKPRFESGS